MNPAANYEFLAGLPPPGYAFNFDNYLFNTLRHMRLQGPAQRLDFLLLNRGKQRIEAKIHFLLEGGVAWSPWRSLFGSFEFNHRLATGLLGGFAATVLDQLAAQDLQRVVITHPAGCYGELKARKVHEVLLGLGFREALRAANHHIPVDGRPLTAKMHGMELRRLKRCRQAGLAFGEEPADRAEEIYRFIAECRSEQGLKPSVDYELLQAYLRDFPQQYRLFAVRQGAELCAATVAIRVHKKVLYNFLPASPRRLRNLSPTVLLLEGLYGYAAVRGFEVLDLGISTTPDGRHQEGLIRFKEHMGGWPGWKRRYEIEL
jgi:hypothetical protein